MKFEVINKQEYLQYVKDNPLVSFLQSSAWKEAGEAINEYQGYYLGVKEGTTIVAATLMLYNQHTRLKMAYCPKGPILDYTNKEVIVFFMNSLKAFCKQLGADVLKIEPPFIYKQYKQLGDCIYQYPIDIVETFTNQKFIHSGFYQGYNGSQPRYTIIKQLTDDFNKNYQSSSKRVLKRNSNLVFSLETNADNQIDELLRLRNQLSNKKGFIVKGRKYWEVFYEELKKENQANLWILYLYPKESIEKIELLIESKKQEISKYENNRKKEGIIKDLQASINSLSDLIEEIKPFQNETKIVVGISLNYVNGKRAENFIFHTDDRFEKLKVAVTFYDKQLERYHQMGYDSYDFFGIPGIVENDAPFAGLFIAKSKYGGDLVEYIGDFVYPIHKLKYSLFKWIRKIK